MILMYHRIAGESFDPWKIAVEPQNFADQLSWLTGNRTPLSLVEFASLHRRRALPADAVAVTFDDGYACTAEVAAPLLERFAVPATVFLPAALIGSARSFWWDELQQILLAHPQTVVHALGEDWEIGESRRGDAVWPSDSRKRTARQAGFLTLWSRLQPLPADKIEEAMIELRAQHGPTGAKASHRLMTAEEARSIKSDRISFGSHAMSHVSLPGLSKAEKEREICRSMTACEELVGSRPVSFAYPFGDYDGDCTTLVAKAGFGCACTVEPRPVRDGDDLFALPRLGVGNWTGRRLRQEMAEAALDQQVATNPE